MSGIKRVGGTSNAVVVQLPERQYPGVVIQYDSINNLLALVKDTKNKMLSNDWDEIRDLLDEIESLLSGYVEVFPKKN